MIFGNCDTALIKVELRYLYSGLFSFYPEVLSCYAFYKANGSVYLSQYMPFDRYITIYVNTTEIVGKHISLIARERMDQFTPNLVCLLEFRKRL